ncbi:MAG: hypothetical protein CSB23_05285 [Deltaproteobacteria bacterium]|nr:MAG: hypothetical protein CSB23_05285 [Deltaproteobacteria bacterium]
MLVDVISPSALLLSLPTPIFQVIRGNKRLYHSMQTPVKPLQCLIFFLVILAVFIPERLVLAETTNKAEVRDLFATTSKTHLLLFGELTESITPEMIEIVKNGVPLHFSFFVELYKIEEDWAKERISSLHFQHTMVYDTLKEVYRVTREEFHNRERNCKTLEEALKVLNQMNGVEVTALSQLVPGKDYKVAVKAELFKKNLPLGLQSFFPALSWWDTETDWHFFDFRY